MDHSSPLAKLRIKLQSMENRAHQTVKVSEIAKKNEKHYFFKNFFFERASRRLLVFVFKDGKVIRGWRSFA